MRSCHRACPARPAFQRLAERQPLRYRNRAWARLPANRPFCKTDGATRRERRSGTRTGGSTAGAVRRSLPGSPAWSRPEGRCFALRRQRRSCTRGQHESRKNASAQMILIRMVNRLCNLCSGYSAAVNIVDLGQRTSAAAFRHWRLIRSMCRAIGRHRARPPVGCCHGVPSGSGLRRAANRRGGLGRLDEKES
jgi:hypothetical protein